ncbi:MAG: hypothetical protein R2784_00225 [Saprospiraceae bacterium]
MEDFADMKMVLKGEPCTNDAGEVVTPEVAILYGDFIGSGYRFYHCGFCNVHGLSEPSAMPRKEEAAPAPPPAPSTEEVLYRK